MLLPLSLMLDLLMKDLFDPFFFQLFTDLIIFVFDVIVRFGRIRHRDNLSHFADDPVKMHKSISQNANLKVIAHGTEQSIQFTV